MKPEVSQAFTRVYLELSLDASAIILAINSKIRLLGKLSVLVQRCLNRFLSGASPTGNLSDELIPQHQLLCYILRDRNSADTEEAYLHQFDHARISCSPLPEAACRDVQRKHSGLRVYFGTNTLASGHDIDTGHAWKLVA